MTPPPPANSRLADAAVSDRPSPHPAGKPLNRLDGQVWRNRIQLYDATFGTQKADSFTLHFNGRPSYIRGQSAQPLFDDTKSYWNAKTPSKSVKLPGAGVTLRVVEEKGTSMKVRIGTSAGGLQGVVTR